MSSLFNGKSIASIIVSNSEPPTPPLPSKSLIPLVKHDGSCFTPSAVLKLSLVLSKKETGVPFILILVGCGACSLIFFLQYEPNLIPLILQLFS